MFVLLSTLCAPLRAIERATYVTGLAPLADELFAPLRADPRELQFSVRCVYPDKDVTAAEVAIGHYYGIYRWGLPNGIGLMQVNIGGGIFPRFNFSYNKDLQVIDFYGSIPLDVRIGKWSGRFMFYHVSSHLGDDYIRSSGQTVSNNSWNSLRSLVSYDVNDALRLYGGYTYHLVVLPAEQKREVFQSGFELTSKMKNNNHSQAFLAADAQWWERTQWKPTLNVQIGIKTGRNTRIVRGISYFLEFTKGPEYYGQFFEREENRIGLGLKFDIE